MLSHGYKVAKHGKSTLDVDVANAKPAAKLKAVEGLPQTILSIPFATVFVDAI